MNQDQQPGQPRIGAVLRIPTESNCLQEKNPANYGRIVVGLVAVLSTAVTCWGLVRLASPLRSVLRDRWPEHSLRSMIIVAAAYFLGCAVVWFMPSLRKRFRGIAFGAVLLTAASGAGLGGLAAVVYLLLSSLALGNLLYGRSSDDLKNGLRLESDLSPEQRRDPWIESFISVVLGLILWSLATRFLVYFPINYPPLYLVLLAVPIIVNRKAVSRWGTLLRTSLQDHSQEQVGIGVFALGSLALGFLLLQLTVGMFPEVIWDAQMLHLRVPHYVFQHHEYHVNFSENCLAFLPYFSFWPFTIAYQFGGEPAAKLINTAFFLLTVAGAWRIVGRRLGASWACLAAAIVASTPMFMSTTSTLSPENYFTLGTIALAAVLCERGERISWKNDFRQDAAMAILIAFPLLIKVIGALISAAGFLIWAYQTARDRDGLRFWARSAYVLVIAFIVGGFPYIHAWYRTGNPVFPFYNAVFKSPYYPSDENFIDARWVGHLTPDILYQMTFHSSKFCECYDGTLGFHYIILTLCALVALAVSRSRMVWIGLILILLYGILMLKMQYLRYMVPIAPLIIIVGLIAIAQAVKSSTRLRVITLLVLTAICGLNFLFLPASIHSLCGMPLMAAFDTSAREQFILEKCPARKLVSDINAAYGDKSRVAVLGNFVGLAELQGMPFYAMWYNPEFNADVSNLKTRSQVLAWLKKWQLTHVLQASDFSNPILVDVLSSLAKSRQELRGITMVEIDSAKTQ